MSRRMVIGLAFVLVLGLALLVEGGWATPTAIGQTIPPVPAMNDNFADATVISALPFQQRADIRLATLEPFEPAPCGWGQFDKSVWYSFTPDQNVTVTARAKAYEPWTWWWDGAYAVYTGSALDNLSRGDRPCGEFYGDYTGGVTFQAEAGVTYHIQIGGMYGGNGIVDFTLDLAPPPEIGGIGYWPDQPSIYEPVQFNSWSWDPANIGIASWFWDFGDGKSGEGEYPSHQYGADGEYDVRLDVTTHDGRTASAFVSPLVVKTRDVAITKFSTPNAAREGQTKKISVGVNSRLDVEEVEVVLYRSRPGGFEEIGRSKQTVPVRSANRTTDFVFSYTFTHEDGEIGKVTFKAEAFIIGGRDALPADNTMLSAPLKTSDVRAAVYEFEIPEMLYLPAIAR